MQINATPLQLDALAHYTALQCEATRLYRALPFQSPIFRSRAREILIRGGNRGSKSLTCAVRIAAIATDRPVYTVEGEQIDCRLPWQKGRPVVIWIIGLGESHIGQTIHRLLFRAGAFQMIRDEKTGLWRTYHPWSESDRQRSAEAKPAPPLIPPRYIKEGSWSWNNKAARVFTKVEIINPETGEELAEIYAFTSKGDVKAGDPVDEIWIDEAIEKPEYYPEWQARIIDRRGRISWSSLPYHANSAMRELTQRARVSAAEDGDNPRVVEFVFPQSGNPFITKEAREDFVRGLSDDERRARDLGEYITDQLRMYNRFNRNIHCAITPHLETEDELSKILRQRNGEPPDDWTRELILDPGWTHPAVLLCAIPPPIYGPYFVPYQEIYIPRLDADGLAEAIEPYVQGHWFHRFIIDSRAGRQHPMSFGITVERNYAEAFQRRRLTCAMTGSWFTWGSDDVAGRIGVLQSWLTVRRGGFPGLRIVVDRCPSLCRQLESYEKQQVKTDISEFKPALRQQVDLAVAAEYWAASRPQWVPPPPGGGRMSLAHKQYLQILVEFNQRHAQADDGHVYLGPKHVTAA